MMSFRRLRHRLSRTRLGHVLKWLRHRHLREDDVFIASYPRSGSTWLRSLLSELLTGSTPSFALLDGRSSPVPDLGKHRRIPSYLPGDVRLIKTHELYRPVYGKAIYLVRDPRDVALSEHRFQRWSGFFDRGFDAFTEMYVTGRVNSYGTWSEHVASWLDSGLMERDRLLLLRYEALRADTAEQLRSVAEFLGLEAPPERIENAVRHNSIERMREREDREWNRAARGQDARFRFINRGVVEGWRHDASAAQIQRIETHAKAVMDRLGYPYADAKK